MARPHQVSHDAQPDGRRGSALSGADAHESECATPSTVPADARAEWWAAPEEDVADVGVTGGLLERPLLPLWVFMSVMGVGAPAYHAESRSYRMRWTSPSGAATLAASAAVVALTGVSVVSLARHLLSTEEDPDQRPVQSLKTIGVLIVGGYQVNALVQVLNTAAGAARHARLLSAWTRLAALHHINPTRGLRRKCYIQVAFMTAFIAAMLTAAALGRPRFVGHVLEGNAERLYLIPRSLLRDSASLPAKAVQVAVCCVALHHFAINKSYLFAFTTHCHLLQAALTAWNTHLARAIDKVWTGAGGDGVGVLVHGREQLVALVRDTQSFFSPVLQCYFASTVIIVCTELYLLAQGVGSGLLLTEEVVVLILLTVQTTWLLVHVSLAAAGVQEQAEATGDVLGRGLPYSASPEDKHYVGELTRSLVVSPLHITGGNFFTINRSFILTVVSVVLSYFIVILQFTQSCGSPADTTTTATNTTTTTAANTTLNEDT
ncbi:uncharacterized protein LOC123502141 isoform X1 [Portunus trituberculatus]|uniref:uncharacterized protein LOC123502141 isoform X1 n=1 Tax=Portunus trituberculatus TaxID=210409 RepID=UPI001E1CDA19|nr:uncharacterized protein LOC123502141 isoform X1 [Portunus trituberculatus]